MPRPISKVAPQWWDYTTLDDAILADAAKLSVEDMQSLGDAVREQLGEQQPTDSDESD